MTSSVTRLSLLSHAMTDAMRRARFPSDEPVDEGGLAQLDRVELTLRRDAVVIAPEKRTRQTADRLGLHGGIVADLTDIGFGTWTGRTIDELTETEAIGWLTDTSRTPPDGESIDGLLLRVDRWMNRVADEQRRVVAVTHPAVIRAVVVLALDAPALSFWRVDIPPSTVTTLNYRGGRWTLRSVAERIS